MALSDLEKAAPAIAEAVKNYGHILCFVPDTKYVKFGLTAIIV
jgi:hypothetical protein